MVKMIVVTIDIIWLPSMWVRVVIDKVTNIASSIVIDHIS
jgi:hypothetical protein